MIEKSTTRHLFYCTILATEYGPLPFTPFATRKHGFIVLWSSVSQLSGGEDLLVTHFIAAFSFIVMRTAVIAKVKPMVKTDIE